MNPIAKGALAGAAGVVAALALGGYVAVSCGLVPANADSKPPRWERRIAKKSLHATLERSAPKEANPVALTEANLIEGVKLYAAHCALCHGGPDGERSKIAAGLYIKPPQFAKHPMDHDPEGEIYWMTRHGIRFTGMPAYENRLADDELWTLTLFLKHMEELPPAAKKAWEAVPGVGGR